MLPKAIPSNVPRFVLASAAIAGLIFGLATSTKHPPTYHQPEPARFQQACIVNDASIGRIGRNAGFTINRAHDIGLTIVAKEKRLACFNDHGLTIVDPKIDRPMMGSCDRQEYLTFCFSQEWEFFCEEDKWCMIDHDGKKIYLHGLPDPKGIRIKAGSVITLQGVND